MDARLRLYLMQRVRYARAWATHWWLLLVAFVLLAVGLGLVLRFELMGFESARWTLSALVQGGAALIGILFVAIGLLWNQANQEREKLRRLMEDYMPHFAPDTTAVIDLRNTLCEVYKTGFPTFPDFSQYSERRKMELLKDVFTRLTELVFAASLYLDVNVPSHKFFVGSPEEGLWCEDLEDNYKRRAAWLHADEFPFFAHLMEFDNQLSLLADDMNLKNRVGASVYRLRFFQAFTGRGLKVISCMWLLCITTGILILVSIDKIPPASLFYLVALPVAIGIVAVGITLSLGLRAIRSE